MEKLKKNINYLWKDLLRAMLLLWKADILLASINILLQCIQAILPVASLYVIKQLVEKLVKSNELFAAIIPLLIAFGLIQLLLAVAIQYSSYISTIHQQALTDYLSGEVLDKAIKVDFAYYENPEYHDTLHLAQQQSIFKATQVLNSFNSLILSSLSIIFLVVFFFSLHSLFALFFMVLSVPLAIIKWYSGHALMRMERLLVPQEREANYLVSVLTGATYAKEVRVFGFGSSFIRKFKIIRQTIHHQKKQLHVKLMWYSLAVETAEIIAMTIIFGLLAKYTWEKTITIGLFVVYIQGFQRLQSTSKKFMQSFVQLFQQRVFLKDLFAFFDIKIDRQTNRTPFPNISNGLKAEHISFTYPQTSREVLHDVSIECSTGKIVAIVGENGSGKSTLVKLIARLYDLQSGHVVVNEVNTKDIDPDEFRQQTVFLFQDFEKYFLTIEENIALGEGKKTMTQGNVEQAAKLSGAHGFIGKLTNGYKTRMGRSFAGSEQISGGQWQKLVLARIFYKDTQLVVLDEPTGSLDPNAEFELFKNIKEHLKDKMVILITHRLYNLKLADHIYVMKDGRIAERGTFDELVQKEGIFKKMYEAQKL